MISLRLTRLLCALVFWGVATSVWAQDSIGQRLAAAENALVTGQPAQAANLAQANLAEVPNDFASLFILALAQADLGDDRQSATTAARAYNAAPDDPSKLQAARLVASKRFALGHYMRAEFWLRRAVNHAQTEKELEAIAREYVATINANPLALQFTASIAPSDNINNGSTGGVLIFDGLDPLLAELLGENGELLLDEDKRALSGIRYAGSARLNYQLSESPRQRTSLTGRLSGETFSLSQDAKDLLASSPTEEVRDVEGRDFATLVAELGITRAQFNLSPLGPVSLGLTYGTYYEGDTRLVNYRDIILQQLIPLDERNAFNIRASVRDQKALVDGLVDSQTYDVIGSYNRLLQSDDSLRLSLAWRDSDAGFENSYIEYRAGIDYGLSQRILNTRLSTSLEIGYRTYEEFTTTLDGRDDRFVTAQASVIFEELTYFGFSPSMSVSATRTESTAEEQTTAAVQVLFGIESNF
ncbi:MAG: hypothetical protein AAFX89_06775 [Pseudomonadota bacterium]